MKKLKNSKFLLRVLKNKVLEARKNFQLPFYLTKLVYALKGDENVRYVAFLKEQTETWFRLKGFYKKYPLWEERSERSIRAELGSRGFQSQS